MEQQPMWQPIETAPKDGAWILLGWGDASGETPPAMVFRWAQGFPDFGIEPGPWQGPYSDGHRAHMDDVVRWKPTHWMPLPDPPNG